MKKENVIIFLEGIKSSGRLVHIGLETGRFFNGSVVELDEDSLLFCDNKLGNVAVPYALIINVEPFIKK